MQPLKKGIINATRRQCVEFGQVAVLVVLFLALRARSMPWHAHASVSAVSPPGISAAAHSTTTYILPAFILLLLTIIVPRIFYPFAAAWFGLSGLLGRVSSAVLMSLVFCIIVLPAGLIRKWRGIDPLKLKEFKKGVGSVLHDRNHVYVKEDLLKTF